MVSAFAASFADLYLAFTALEFFSFLDQQLGAGTTASAQAPLLESAAKDMLPLLGATASLFIAIAYMYHLLSRAAVPVAGAGNMRLSELVFSILCVSIGMLEYVLFVQAAGGVDHGAQARALGLAALRALPFAATATFFLGMILIIIAHVFADVEGGDGAVAGEGPTQGPVRFFTNMALGAAMALICMMVMAFYGAKY